LSKERPADIKCVITRECTKEVGGAKVQITGHRSQVTGHRSQFTVHRSQVTGHRSQVKIKNYL